MEDDLLRFIVAHQSTDVRPFETTIGYVDDPGVSGDADTAGPDQDIDDGLYEVAFADLVLDHLT